jgi:hypothetical protein
MSIYTESASSAAAAALEQAVASNETIRRPPGRPKGSKTSPRAKGRKKSEHIYKMACQRQGLDSMAPERPPKRRENLFDPETLPAVSTESWLRRPLAWTDQMRDAAALIAEGSETLRRIAAIVGTTGIEVAKWRQHVEFRAEVSRLAIASRESAVGTGLAGAVRQGAAVNAEIERRIEAGDLEEMDAADLLKISRDTASLIGKIADRLDRKIERRSQTQAKIIEKIVNDVTGMDDAARLRMAQNQSRIFDLLKNPGGVYEVSTPAARTQSKSGPAKPLDDFELADDDDNENELPVEAGNGDISDVVFKQNVG